MSKIDNSPLIEAIFELRWGETHPGTFKFYREERELLPGIFFQSIKSNGYPLRERLDPEAPEIPGFAKYRFRKAPNKWPCYQFGLGLFTANQIGSAAISSPQIEEYDWDDFKPAISEGLKSLIDSYATFDGLPSGKPTAALRYQDGFILGKGESIEDFISHKTNIRAHLAENFLDHPDINSNATDIRMELVFETNKPKGKISISVMSAQIKGEPGVVFETRVSSQLTSSEISVPQIMEWAEDAHTLQRHSFDSLIKTQ
ncbi:TIGR04255 family protein [Alcanivorax sp.]|uniref:TIGR04255 family protein n=1 Tax=Alcanivorax sp. TaxID=1872427 RepID=UPI003A93AFB9